MVVEGARSELRLISVLYLGRTEKIKEKLVALLWFNVLGAKEISNDWRTPNHDGFLSFDIHSSKGDGFGSTEPNPNTGETWIPVCTEMTDVPGDP